MRHRDYIESNEESERDGNEEADRKQANLLSEMVK
jgi:hypothetical protein